MPDQSLTSPSTGVHHARVPRSDRIGKRSEQRQHNHRKGSQPSTQSKRKSSSIVYNSDSDADDTNTMIPSLFPASKTGESANRSSPAKRPRRADTDDAESGQSTQKAMGPSAKKQKKTSKKKDLPFHPELIQIREGDLSFLPSQVPQTAGSKPSALVRLQVGTYQIDDEDDNEKYPAWMFIANSAKALGTVKACFVKTPARGDRQNQLPSQCVDFAPAFAMDERFEGSQEYRAADPLAQERLKEWKEFLVNAYRHYLPTEEEKLKLDPEEQRELDSTLKSKGSKSKRPRKATRKNDESEEERNEDEEEGEEGGGGREDGDDNPANVMKAFERDYPGLTDDQEIWDGYNLGKIELDLEKDYICDRIRLAWSNVVTSVGQDGPPNKVLRNAQKARRKNKLTRCVDSIPFYEWQIQARGGSKTYEMISWDRSAMEMMSSPAAKSEARQGQRMRDFLGEPKPVTDEDLSELRRVCRELVKVRASFSNQSSELN